MRFRGFRAFSTRGGETDGLREDCDVEDESGASDVRDDVRDVCGGCSACGGSADVADWSLQSGSAADLRSSSMR